MIAAEGENKAARALREASDIINESSSAMQLRYLQTLNSISAEKNSTIIFPLPIEFMTHFMRSSSNNGPSTATNGGGRGSTSKFHGAADGLRVKEVAIVPSCPSAISPENGE